MLVDWIHAAAATPAEPGRIELFLRSPGFGGLAAVVAAAIAFLGVVRSNATKRKADRKQQWWDRARWALDLLLGETETARDVGVAALDALSLNEYAKVHEKELINAVLTAGLARYVTEDPAAGHTTSPGPATPGGAESEQDDEGGAP